MELLPDCGSPKVDHENLPGAPLIRVLCE
jgi:hypothetical protein